MALYESDERKDRKAAPVPITERRFKEDAAHLAQLPEGDISREVAAALAGGESAVDVFIGSNFRTEAGRNANEWLSMGAAQLHNVTRTGGTRLAVAMLDSHPVTHEAMQHEAFGGRMGEAGGEKGLRKVMSNLEQIDAYLGAPEATSDLRDVIRGYVRGELTGLDIVRTIGETAQQLGYEGELVMLSTLEARKRFEAAPKAKATVGVEAARELVENGVDGDAAAAKAEVEEVEETEDHRDARVSLHTISHRVSMFLRGTVKSNINGNPRNDYTTALDLVRRVQTGDMALDAGAIVRSATLRGFGTEAQEALGDYNRALKRYADVLRDIAMSRHTQDAGIAVYDKDVVYGEVDQVEAHLLRLKNLI